MTHATAYLGEGGTALCGPSMMLLLATEPESTLVSAVWPHVLNGNLSAVLAALTGSGIDRLPHFGLVVDQPDAIRVLVRGTVNGCVQLADGQTETMAAGQVTTWQESAFPVGLAGAVLSCADTMAGVGLPLVAGIVRAGWVERRFSADVSRPPLEKSPLLEESKATLHWPEPEQESQSRSFEAGSPTTGVQPPVVNPAPPPPPPSPPRRPGMLMDRVGWLSEDAPARIAQPQAPQPQAPQGDRFGDTIRRSENGQGPVPQTPAVTHRVRAIRCPRWHLNPPASTSCRECREPVDEHQMPEEVDQPTLGVLRRVSTGEEWTLAKPLTVIGREPRANVAVATLIPTAGASPDVSRIHVEIRLQGWSVEVIDCSTHGTEIVNPGHHPVRLEKGQPVRILPGAELVLAGAVTFRYEVS